MSSDMQCPYCNADQEICHDDWFGHEEDAKHEHTCTECSKSFVFSTSIRVYYKPSKADCLNGESHKLIMSKTYPKRYSMMRCQDCGYQRTPTNDEFIVNGISTVDIVKEFL